MRICRITRLHPRSGWPASGLAAYNLSRDIPHPCLYITKDLGDEPLPFPDHVHLAVFSYPEPRAPDRIGRLQFVTIGLGKLVGSMIFLLKALPHMIRFRPQIIHIHTILPLLLGMVGKLIFGVPLVLTFQGTDYYYFKTSRLLQGLVQQWVDTVICVSNDMEMGLKSLLPNKYAVYVPNGVDTDLFRDHGMPRKDQLIAVSRLCWQKGYRDLLYAMKQVVAKRPQYSLLIVGNGPLQSELEELVSSLDLEHHVTFAGILPQVEIAQRLNESRLFVLSSVTEGLPKALLEAMACGTPVVVTDVGDCGLVAQGAGLVVPPAQPEALAKAILTLLEDQKLWESASRQGQETVKSYTWQARAPRVLVEYERLLNAH